MSSCDGIAHVNQFFRHCEEKNDDSRSTRAMPPRHDRGNGTVKLSKLVSQSTIFLDFRQQEVFE
ncbi:hypothetical protein [Rickettsia sp. MEAM1 (Bemisia tabaci)]|uniref:hypothetical protein n=1 Tax=Rickettsia sp. MEAM1 (Bemisia tabaci) TaxID=1182263 RepID=UPI00138F8F28|nr:hypothetical protein [Rickettsia sp. MEAM1 (Bemisia tabaci)]